MQNHGAVLHEKDADLAKEADLGKEALLQKEAELKKRAELEKEAELAKEAEGATLTDRGSVDYSFHSCLEGVHSSDVRCINFEVKG